MQFFIIVSTVAAVASAAKFNPFDISYFSDENCTVPIGTFLNTAINTAQVFNVPVSGALSASIPDCDGEGGKDPTCACVIGTADGSSFDIASPPGTCGSDGSALATYSCTVVDA